MATIVNNPSGERERVVETGAGGWAVSVIILLAVIVIGAFVWMRYGNAPAPAQQNTPGSAQINLTLPSGGSDNGASSDANSGTPSGNSSGTSGNTQTNPATQ